MDKTELKTKFENYLGDTGKNQRELELTVNTFTNKVFDMFLNGLESYRNGFSKSYREIFFHAVVPLMRDKLDIFGNHDFKEKTYERYESLFIDFMKFASKNKEYINSIMFDGRKEKLENLVEGQYGKIFDKKSFLEAWHSRIKEDTGKNGDKHRKYLADIYGYLSNRQLNLLYEIFFNSYEICSKINGKNSEHKGKENYEKRDAFDEAFSNIKSKLYGFDGEKLSEIKSLFGKYLNFIPKYRNRIKDVLDDDALILKGSDIQDKTKENIIYSIRDPNGANYDVVYGEVIAPLDNYGIFPDFDPVGEGDVENDKTEEFKSNNGAQKKTEGSTRGMAIRVNDEEDEEEGENPDYTGDYTDFYRK